MAAPPRFVLSPQCRSRALPRPDGQPVCVQAIAGTGPRRLPAPPFHPMRIVPTGDRTRVELEVVAIRNGTDWQPASGRARLTVQGHLLGVHAGDRLQVFGQLASPEGPLNPGQFEFALHARGDRRLSAIQADYPDCVTVATAAGPLSPARWLDGARTAGERLIRDRIQEPHRGVAEAVLLGIRDDVSTEQIEAFVETGTIHVLSISGLHVGVLAATLFLLMRGLAVRRKRAAAAVAATVAFYVLLTGAEPPAVRAMIVVLVACAGYAWGRRPLSFNALGAAALAVLAMNPADLFRVGVQLSFLCVAVLCSLGGRSPLPDHSDSRLQRLVAESRPWLVRAARRSIAWVRDLTWAGAFVWLATLPLVMARFHMVPVVGLVLNTLLWLPATLIVWSGLGALALGGVLPWLATPLARCCDWSVAVLQSGIEWARQLPGAYVWVPGPAEWWLVGFYGGLVLLAVFVRRRLPRRWRVALAAGWIAAGMLPSLAPHAPPRLTGTFLAVDHGCAVVLRLPSGATMLYDAGHFASPDSATQAIAGYLWSEGITRIDAVVLSHADADHFNAVPRLLERFSVGAAYVSPVMFERNAGSVRALRESLRGAAVPVHAIAAGDRLSGGEGCRIEVLHPPRAGTLGGDNPNSIVLAVEYRGRRLLLTGDLEPPGLNEVVAEEPWRCDVLLAPHHGGQAANAPALAAWASPKWVVISAGRRLDVSRTMAAYRNAGAQVLHTAHTGAIQFEIDAKGLEVRTFQ